MAPLLMLFTDPSSLLLPFDKPISSCNKIGRRVNGFLSMLSAAGVSVMSDVADRAEAAADEDEEKEEEEDEDEEEKEVGTSMRKRERADESMEVFDSNC